MSGKYIICTLQGKHSYTVFNLKSEGLKCGKAAYKRLRDENYVYREYDRIFKGSGVQQGGRCAICA